MAFIDDTYARQLQRNNSGARVKYLQSLLGLETDGLFGKKTAAAVSAFQKNNKLNADGVVDYVTAQKICEAHSGEIDMLLYTGLVAHAALPVTIKGGKAGMCEAFGNPWVSGFKQAHLVVITLPGAMFSNGKAVSFLGHVYMQQPLMTIATEMCNHGLKFKTFDGCWNVRYIRGSSTKWSVHSWGCALDFDCDRNPLGAKPTMEPAIVKIFEDNGFVWGGRWSRPDGMHFQLVKNY